MTTMTTVIVSRSELNSVRLKEQLSLGGVGGGAERVPVSQTFFFQPGCTGFACEPASHLFCHQLSTGSGEYLWPAGQESRV